MAKEIIAPLNNYPNGTFSFAPRNIADTDTRVLFELLRCTSADNTIWPNASTLITMTIEQFSASEWREVCGLRDVGGGIINGKNGTEADVTSVSGVFFAGTNRQIRGSFTVSGGPIRSSALLEVT